MEPITLTPPPRAAAGPLRRVVTALLALLVLSGTTPAAATQTQQPSTPPETATLTLKVTGLRSTAGHLHVAVYDDPARFPQPGGQHLGLSLPLDATTLTVTVPDLPPGTYAIAAYHDENGNGRFDRGLLGVPLEGFGFSADAPVLTGPPRFRTAAVTIHPPHARTSLRMRYGLGF